MTQVNDVTRAGRRIAVVLFNLGGPDRPDSVQPFLFNLFNDKSIIRLPGPLRFLLATLVSRRRAKEAGAIYAELGGGSPLLPNTQAQAASLEETLAGVGTVRVFIAMRYWHPMSDETAMAVADFAPEEVILLPLYPQFSTTTTASSLRVWKKAADAAGIRARTRTVCCYPTETGFVAASVAGVRRELEAASSHGRPRLLLSAHGLPESVVKGGDPYQWQCEQTAAEIMAALDQPDLDWVSCYQSRVGPLKWIGPATDDEIRRAGAEGRPIVVVPVAFVSEHSETLVELDIEYRELAEAAGVPYYGRVPTVATDGAFIDGLAALVRKTLGQDGPLCSQIGGRLCPRSWRGCPWPQTAVAK